MNDKDLTRSSPTERLLAFLDAAYEGPFDPNGFDEIMQAAEQYLFDNDLQAIPAEHLHALPGDTYLQGHVVRLQKLLDLEETRQRARPVFGGSDRLVSVIIDTSMRCTGNANAARLFDIDFPCRIEELDLSHDSAALVSDAMRDIRRGHGIGPDILMLEHGKSERQYVARMTPHQSRDRDTGEVLMGLALTIVHIAWSAETLKTAQKTFQLTDSEREVLLCYLNGMSQAQIAEERGRSVETIKSQSKSILGKSGAGKMTDLIGLMVNIALFAEPVGDRPRLDPSRSRRLCATESVPVSGGRSVGVTRVGAPDGLPVLFCHGLLMGPFFSDFLIDEFSRSGLHVIAPSRPGFADTSAPADWAKFDQTCVEDAHEVVARYFGDSPVTIVAHQGGVSHACRIATRLGAQARGMLMVGAGIPINERKHLRYMNTDSRVGALAARYTPAILEMLLRLGINKWNRIGPVAYLRNFFRDSPADLEAMKDPKLLSLYRQGAQHMVAQGPAPVVKDGQAAMADWTADYEAVPCPISWLHGTADPIMRHDFVIEWAEKYGHGPVDLIEGGASGMIYVHPSRFLRALKRLLHATDPQK